jgi:hypothetical protein
MITVSKVVVRTILSKVQFIRTYHTFWQRKFFLGAVYAEFPVNITFDKSYLSTKSLNFGFVVCGCNYLLSAEHSIDSIA